MSSAGGPGAGTPPGRRPLRVLGDPAFANAHTNPHQALLYTEVAGGGHVVRDHTSERLRREPWDVWHLHWPDLKLRGRGRRRARALVDLARFRADLEHAARVGTRIVWTVHNLHGHEAHGNWPQALLMRLLLRHLDGVIHLSEAGRGLALAAHPVLRTLPSAVIPRGHYRSTFEASLTREEARGRLSLPVGPTLLAFVGRVREYKNLPRLLHAAGPLLRSGRTELLIAGLPSRQPLRAALERTAASLGPAAHLRLWFQSPQELQACLVASDLVVLPYADGLNSGSAIAATSVDRPVMLPRTPVFTELRERVGHPWVTLYDGELETADLRESLAWVAARRPQGPADWPYSWHEAGRATVDFYRRLAATPALT